MSYKIINIIQDEEISVVVDFGMGPFGTVKFNKETSKDDILAKLDGLDAKYNEPSEMSDPEDVLGLKGYSKE